MGSGERTRPACCVRRPAGRLSCGSDGLRGTGILPVSFFQTWAGCPCYSDHTGRMPVLLRNTGESPVPPTRSVSRKPGLGGTPKPARGTRAFPGNLLPLGITLNCPPPRFPRFVHATTVFVSPGGAALRIPPVSRFRKNTITAPAQKQRISVAASDQMIPSSPRK